MDRILIVAFRDVFLVELSDLLDAEDQLLRELPLMAARATSSELRDLLEEHYRATHRHVHRLEVLFDRLEERRRWAVSQAMRGLIHDARERYGSWERGAALDAAILGTAQHIEHYEMAAYSSARLYALAIGDAEASRSLQQTLEEECETERRVKALLERTLAIRSADTIAREPAKAPTSLMPGVWVTETTGFASVPPRAESDLRPLQHELMVARGDEDARVEVKTDSGR